MTIIHYAPDNMQQARCGQRTIGWQYAVQLHTFLDYTAIPLQRCQECLDTIDPLIVLANIEL